MTEQFKKALDEAIESLAWSQGQIVLDKETFKQDISKIPLERMVVVPIPNKVVTAAHFGANWVLNHLWHDAQGDDLPEIDREVIVLQENGRVCFGHRPYKKGYLGKNLVTGNIETYYPETYGKGGWNIPNIKYWLDVEFPKAMKE